MMQIHPTPDRSLLRYLSANVYTLRNNSRGEVANSANILLGPFPTLAVEYSEMQINLQSLKGDVNLYVGKNRVPTTSISDCASKQAGHITDKCKITDMVAGDYVYVLIEGNGRFLRAFGDKSKYQVQVGAKKVSN